MESNIGVVYVCHASDADIAGFADKPVMSQWQLIKMPTAPLLHLTLVVLDAPIAPYQFESFLNVAAEDQANVLAQLANQDRLYLAFYGDDLTYRFTKVIDHNAQQRQQLDELVSLHTLSFEWVAGHAGHEENERCDELAVAAYQQYL